MLDFCNKIFNEDYINIVSQLPDACVDMVLTDPPYMTTECHWDKSKWDIMKWWDEILRVTKPNAAIVVFSQMPFTVDMVSSQRKLFRYEWIWEKTCGTGFLNAKKMPLKYHENILVFYNKLPTYNPVKWFSKVRPQQRTSVVSKCYNNKRPASYGSLDGSRYPKDVIIFKKDKSRYNSSIIGKHNHPTAKPVELMKYFIQTYSNEGDIILDTFAGCCPVAKAAIEINRQYICIEKDPTYYEWALEKLSPK